MIERVVENWLTEATERTYEVAFCYMLTHKGYSVVHLTRHCSMELGKDVIATAPDGTPCAFQLKGGGLSLSEWRDDVSRQVDDLVMGELAHPAVRSDQEHIPYLVTNGYIQEEVQRVIEDRNRGWEDRGYEPLRVWNKAHLLDWATDLGSELWPTELGDVNQLIELHLSNGKQPFPKAKHASLLEASLPLESENDPSTASCRRSLASGALLTALAVAPYSEEENHVAEIEAWTVYSAYVMALAERWSLDESDYERELTLAKRAVLNSLSRLVEEVYEREYYFEGRGALDGPFYSVRLTWVISMLSVFGLFRKSKEHGEVEISLREESAFEFDEDAFIGEFCNQHSSELELWGEAAVPQFLAYYWYWRSVDASRRPMQIVGSLVRTISESNHPRNQPGLPSPYYEAVDVLPYYVDSELRDVLDDHLRVEESPLPESFSGYSFSLEGLFLLLVDKLYRQNAEHAWPGVSKIIFSRYIPDERWKLYRWRNQEAGEVRNEMPQKTRSWSELRERATNPDIESIPSLLREEPWFALLFLVVYPHRINTDYLLWLDSALRKEAHRI